MNIRAYLPSVSFSTTAGALLASGTLIFFAYTLTQPKNTSSLATTESGGAGDATAAWQQAFGSNTTYEKAVDLEAQAQQLISNSKTDNLTDTIARTILISTSAAQGEGLGSDVPTQARIVSDALNQIPSQSNRTPFLAKDIQTVPATAESLRTFGNELAEAVDRHPLATYGNAMLAVSIAVDNNNAASLSKLPAIAKEYGALAADILALPTPQTLLSTTLQIANNYTSMAEACVKMQSVIADPLSGVVGIQAYNGLAQQNIQAFAQAALALKTAGVQFTATDPGKIWPEFLIAVQDAAKRTEQASRSSAASN